MPAIIKKDKLELWLDPSIEDARLLESLLPYPSEHLTYYPVSALLNSPLNKGAEVLDRDYLSR